MQPKRSHQRHDQQLLLTCEHGGNEIPRAYAKWFQSAEAQAHLRSHRGYDPGALGFAQQLAPRLNCELHFSVVSRLLIELNRSLDSPQLFSKFSRGMDAAARQSVVTKYYQPLRCATSRTIGDTVNAGRVAVHLSIHSFTPRFCGMRRNFDIGILFDPERSLESEWSQQLIHFLKISGLNVEPNQPYLGTADGHTTELRKQFPASNYVGIEIEINNRIAKLSAKTRQNWLNQLTQAILSSKQAFEL